MEDVKIVISPLSPDEFHEKFRELSEQLKHIVRQRHEIEMVENDLVRLRDDLMINYCLPPKFRPLNKMTIRIPGHLAKH